jgi:hypothetical protein
MEMDNLDNLKAFADVVDTPTIVVTTPQGKISNLLEDVELLHANKALLQMLGAGKMVGCREFARHLKNPDEILQILTWSYLHQKELCKEIQLIGQKGGDLNEYIGHNCIYYYL